MLINPGYYYYRCTRDLTNLSLIRHPGANGYLVSMQNAGTHWLRYMVSLAMAQAYGYPPPEFVHDNDFVCSPRQKSKYHELPRVVSSHQIPNPLLSLPGVEKLIKFPKYLLLLRDPRHALVANYRKHRHEYGIDFSDYLRGDVALMRARTGRKKFVNDIWWILRFINSWQRMQMRIPEQITVIKYEALRADTTTALQAALRSLDLSMPDLSTLQACVAQSSKEIMAAKEGPRAKYQVVYQDQQSPLAIYSDADKDFLLKTFAKYASTTFGYDLNLGW